METPLLCAGPSAFLLRSPLEIQTAVDNGIDSMSVLAFGDPGRVMDQQIV